jgi:hypothetical protein|tara:strand:+ start:41 stop:229 length:189 start_codon:yes stop_codon:yes gene_type:complete
MKEVAFTELKRMRLADIKKGQCLRVPGDGWNETAFYVVVRPEQFMKARVEGLCSQIDASRGL